MMVLAVFAVCGCEDKDVADLLLKADALENEVVEVSQRRSDFMFDASNAVISIDGLSMHVRLGNVEASLAVSSARNYQISGTAGSKANSVDSLETLEQSMAKTKVKERKLNAELQRLQVASKGDAWKESACQLVFSYKDASRASLLVENRLALAIKDGEDGMLEDLYAVRRLAAAKKEAAGEAWRVFSDNYYYD